MQPSRLDGDFVMNYTPKRQLHLYSATEQLLRAIANCVVPHVSSSLTTSHVLIHPWTTAERSDPEWVPYRGTGTADQADLAKLGSTQLNLTSLHLTSI